MSKESRFGHLIDNWEAVKQEVREILIECARQRKTITYGELSSRLKTAHIPAYSYAMSALLGEIIREGEAEEWGILATLVVRKSDGLPGAGYFKAMAARGIPASEYRAIWETEFKRVCDYWQQH
ncbi:MAG: hypothetical protein CUN55_00030 [Phototrophicales bacterium]|nr:MAG: hypothetical protein CUN55_00030 [Phototrophicales bacterium]